MASELNDGISVQGSLKVKLSLYLSKYHATKTCWVWRYSATRS